MLTIIFAEGNHPSRRRKREIGLAEHGVGTADAYEQSQVRRHDDDGRNADDGWSPATSSSTSRMSQLRGVRLVEVTVSQARANSLTIGPNGAGKLLFNCLTGVDHRQRDRSPSAAETADRPRSSVASPTVLIVSGIARDLPDGVGLQCLIRVREREDRHRVRQHTGPVGAMLRDPGRDGRNARATPCDRAARVRRPAGAGERALRSRSLRRPSTSRRSRAPSARIRSGLCSTNPLWGPTRPRRPTSRRLSPRQQRDRRHASPDRARHGARHVARRADHCPQLRSGHRLGHAAEVNAILAGHRGLPRRAR